MAVMWPAVVTVLLLHSVTCQELISLDSACGVILQSSCPDLQKYVVGKTLLARKIYRKLNM